MTATAAPSLSAPAKEDFEDKCVVLAEVRRDGGTQSRAQLDEKVGARYAREMKDGAVFPRIIVFHGIDDRPGSPTYGESFYWLASGFHRHYAMLLNGIKQEFVKVKKGTRREAVLFSVGSNPNNVGLQRSPEDKAHAVRLVLSDRDWWDKADNWVAQTCHVSPGFVGKVRDQVIAEEELRRQERAKKRAQGQQSPAPAPSQAQKAEQPVQPSQLFAANSSADTSVSAELSTDAPARAQPSAPAVPLVEPAPEPETTQTDEDQTRLGRDGKVRKTKNIGKRRKPVVKPVIVETEIEQKAKTIAQVLRSGPKYARQSKALGWSLEEALKDFVRRWKEIPVVDEQGHPVIDPARRYTIDEAGNVMGVLV